MIYLIYVDNLINAGLFYKYIDYVNLEQRLFLLAKGLLSFSFIYSGYSFPPDIFVFF